MTEDVPHGTRLLRPGDVPVTRVDSVVVFESCREIDIVVCAHLGTYTYN